MVALHVGLALVAMAALLQEILLLRVFSVTTWYHYAFAAVSLAMTGTAMGAAAVHLLPRAFPAERTRGRMAEGALLFGLSVPASFAASLALPAAAGGDPAAAPPMLPLLLLFAVNAVPFFLCGIVVCLGLTRFPGRSGSLYAADLTGAAAGCAGAVALLSAVSGPTAIVVAGALGAAGAAVLAGPGRRVLLGASLASAAGLLAFAAHNERTLLERPGQAPLSPRTVKGWREPLLRYERWNAHSRITVVGDPGLEAEPFGWGFPERTLRGARVAQLLLLIDSHAATPLTRFHGDRSRIAFLRDDIVNLAHHVRPGARVLVVGAGGGRDVLSALAFDQPRVTGVEVNAAIVDALRGPFGDFTGHLDRIPGVDLVRDEARSFLAGSDARYDVLQLSLVDTWAATAAGAFVLTENSLYTVEAWGLFLDRLTERGILSSTRWWPADRPAEIRRTVSLAAEALRRRGAANPADHIAVARTRAGGGGEGPEAVGTILVGRSPLTPADVAGLERACRERGFELAAAPGRPGDRILAALAAPGRPDALLDAEPLRIDAPTDRAPYFFQMLRLRDFADPSRAAAGRTAPFLGAVATLVRLLLLSLLLAAAALLVPLLGPAGHRPRAAAPFAAYFAAIGLGFLLAEISLLQGLTVHLGHPVYGLSVLLFALLLGAGAGSAWSRRFAGSPGPRTLLAVAGIVAVLGFAVPPLLARFAGSPLPVRAGLAALLVAPMGAAMGLPFPLGMAAVQRAAPALGPGLWGINGAFSVVGSVLAVVTAISLGIPAVLGAGVACYLAAAASMRAFPTGGGDPP